jgi:hypothetical protein
MMSSPVSSSRAVSSSSKQLASPSCPVPPRIDGMPRPARLSASSLGRIARVNSSFLTCELDLLHRFYKSGATKIHEFGPESKGVARVLRLSERRPGSFGSQGSRILRRPSSARNCSQVLIASRAAASRDGSTGPRGRQPDLLMLTHRPRAKPKNHERGSEKRFCEY